MTDVMLRAAIVLLATVGVAAAQPAPEAKPADAIALLPLDADARLEIYGQPVASELARAFSAGGLEVVVVGPKMAVPDRARLIVDGKIKSKGDAVVLSIRLRDRVDGKVLDTLESTAPTLPEIDRAAADLSARGLPVVRQHLAAFHTTHGEVREEKTPPPLVLPSPAAAPLATAIVGLEPMRGALATSFEAAARASQREPRRLDPGKLAKPVAAKGVSGSGADRGVLLEVFAFTIQPGVVPLARARVHVRIASATGIVFDRVVVTDTIVGERAMTPDALAARTAAEVLVILRPHLRRAVPAWR